MKVLKTSTVAVFGILILMLAPIRPANAGGEFGLHIGSVHLDFGPYRGGYVRPIYPAPAPVPVPVPYYNYGYYYYPDYRSHQHGYHNDRRHDNHHRGHSAYRHGNGRGHEKHGYHH